MWAKQLIIRPSDANSRGTNQTASSTGIYPMSSFKTGERPSESVTSYFHQLPHDIDYNHLEDDQIETAIYFCFSFRPCCLICK